MAMVPFGEKTPRALQDETIDELNARLPAFNDHALGYGFLDGQVKQKLTKWPSDMSPQFFPFVGSQDKLGRVDNTSTMKAALRAQDAEDLTSLTGVDLAFDNKKSADRLSLQKEIVAVYSFKRVIAYRNISMPHFADLLPVRQGNHKDEGGRWRTELFGNSICIEERYGGKADISFTWSSDADFSALSLDSKIRASVGSAVVRAELIKQLEISKVQCGAYVVGFSHPSSVASSVTVGGAMDLIQSLNTLPIERAALVDTLTVPVQNVSGFPHDVYVETQTREKKLRKKVADLMLRLQQVEQRSTPVSELLAYLQEKIQEASTNDRSLLPELSSVVSSVELALADHGRCVQVFDLDGEQRLHTDNCDKKPVTSLAVDSLAVVTVGLSIPMARMYQNGRFSESEPWAAPKHYTRRKIDSIRTATGLYNRVKYELLFDDEALVSRWRAKVDDLFANRPHKHYWEKYPYQNWLAFLGRFWCF